MSNSKRVWKKVNGAKGIRYFEHDTNKYKGKPDKYFTVRWSHGDQKSEEGIGWTSEGWKASEIIHIRHTLQQNYKKGSGPTTFSELKKEHENKKLASLQLAEKEKIKDITFQEFFEQYYIPWKRDRKKRKTWTDDVKRANHRIHPFLGNFPLTSITSDLLQEFMDSLYDDGLADATVLHQMAVIRATFNLAATTLIEGITVFSGQSPFSNIDLPKVDQNQRERFLTKDEAKLILNKSIENMENANSLRKQSWQDIHDAITLSLNTGMRLGEIQRVEWHDVNFYGKSITIRLISSGQKPGGSIPLNKTAIEMLQKRKEKSTAGALIFPPIAGGKKRENLSHLFKALIDSLDLNKFATSTSQTIVFHSLRHTFASWLAIAGVDIYRIKTLMRHKTITMTMRYAHLSPDLSQGAVELLATE